MGEWRHDAIPLLWYLAMLAVGKIALLWSRLRRYQLDMDRSPIWRLYLRCCIGAWAWPERETCRMWRREFGEKEVR